MSNCKARLSPLSKLIRYGNNSVEIRETAELVRIRRRSRTGRSPCPSGDPRLRPRRPAGPCGSVSASLGHVARRRDRLDEALNRYRTAASLFEVLQDSSAVGQLLAEAGRLSIVRGRYSEAVTDLRAAAERVSSDLRRFSIAKFAQAL